jgi:hypothetical protein
MTKYKPTLIEHFKDIDDPHLLRKQLHKLDDIFFLRNKIKKIEAKAMGE